MKSLEVKKYELYNDENYYNIELSRDDKTLSIFFGGNLDLYFSLKNFNDNPTFIIGKDNYEIYALFDELYNNVVNVNIYEKLTEKEINFIILMSELGEEDYHPKIAEELKRREKYERNLKKSIQYKNLVQDGVIIWKSDEYFDEIAPFIKIKKLANSYLLTFGKPIISPEYKNDADFMLEDPRVITIRIRNSGSRYEPFNTIFMKLYQRLCMLEDECHQIHIEEYLIGERISKGESLKRILPK